MKNYIKIIIATAFLLASCSHVQQPLDENIVPPVLKNEPKLIYPLSAQESNKFGTSVVLFTVSNEGIVKQTRVYKSSGFKELDVAAENYCKGLVFDPAIQFGEPIASNMKWEIKFNLKEFGYEVQGKITDVVKLYSQEKQLVGSERLSIQKEILKKHNSVISEIKDGLKLNEYIYSVVQNNIADEWKHESDSYPLSFLLYHDFITRFADYDSLSAVRSRLEYALNQDLNYLTSTSNIGDSNFKKATLIQKIKKFVENHYPYLKLNNLEIELKNNNLS